MQTFLPYPDFTQSAKCLDYRRLGKQRVEVLQLLTALSSGPEQHFLIGGNSFVKKTPWYNHPATKMWRGYGNALVSYGIAVCDEWLERGYKDTCLLKIKAYREYGYADLPPWFGNEDFHAAHRSNLLRKDPEWYSQFGWTVPDDLPYIWPVA